MANQFLITKWKIWYDSLDVNHDGTISVDDVEESRQKFSELHSLDADKAKEVSKNFEDWWTKYIFRDSKSKEISESDFIDMLSKDYTANQKKFKEDMVNCFNSFFDVIDTNKDRSIDEGEFKIAFKAYGHETVATSTNFFQSYKPNKGLVPLRDVVNSWIEFVTSDDASKPGIVKNAFEACSAKK